MQTFEELGLSEDLVKNLSKASITTPTEIQSKAIPVLLTKSTDLVALAQTGTGKTASFGLPLLQLVDPYKSHTQAVVMAPTRELAQQIQKSLAGFAGKERLLSIQVVHGGAPIINQIRSLEKQAPHILIATPGRLIDLIKRKKINLEKVDTFVLDEADEMLNMGFKEPIYEVLSTVQDSRNIWLFSATMANDIRKICKEFMNNPIEITTNAKQQINQNIHHQYCIVRSSDKQAALERFIDFYPDLYGVVFCRTKRDTQRLAEQLNKGNQGIDALHGDLNQNQRDIVMNRFRKKQVQLLIATDVAARGIDVEDLTHVFHYALPDDMAFYTHRSGRTARAGKTGKSITLANQTESRKLLQFCKKQGIEPEKIDVPSTDSIKKSFLEKWMKDIEEVELSSDAENSILQDVQLFVYQMGVENFINKLTTLQLNRISHVIEHDFSVSGRNSKESSGQKTGRKSAQDKGGKNSRFESQKDNSSGVRFFINIGSDDQTDQTELKEFICEVSGLEKGQISKIKMDRRHSFFDIDQEMAKSFSQRFKNMTIDGRELRVNRDQPRDKSNDARKGKKQGGNQRKKRNKFR